jgi:ubiquitin carboxyl-terminal hydrolase L3
MSEPTTTTAATTKPKAFVPLEANPETITSLLRRLGVRPSLAMHDVFSIDEPALLAMVPRPAHALLLVFPTSAAYEAHRLAADATAADYGGRGAEEPVVWFRQTITNACGMMAVLHAVCNGEAANHIEPNSDLATLLSQALPLAPAQRAALIETSPALASAHATAAAQGDTAAPEAGDDVDLHYVAFVRGRDGALWELDGRRKGPIRLGELDSSEDVLSDKALALGVKKFIERENADLRFSCLVLGPAEED